MWTYVIIVLSVTRCACEVMQSFPATMKLGASTSAYQIEGGWKDDGKAPSVWDGLVHRQPSLIGGGATGDVACDSYHQWERDVEMAAELGLHFYQFSISWSRLFPTESMEPNKAAVAYYTDLIDALLVKGVEPIVTLHYMDLPMRLNDLDGWHNPLMPYWFSLYAREVFALFSDKVFTWITIANPMIICNDVTMQNDGIWRLRFGPTRNTFLCAKHIVLAHARAWQIYKKDFKPTFKGKVSISNDHVWFERANLETPESRVDMARMLLVGMFTHPIYSKEGGWPREIKKFIAMVCKRDGFEDSMPAFDEREKKFVQGSYDFYGLAYFTARMVRSAKFGEPIERWPLHGSPELHLVMGARPDWQPTHANWFYSFPKGLRYQLAWVKMKYGDIKVFITENGYVDDGNSLNDQGRVQYLKEHLEQVMLSIHRDKVNVVGYGVWCLMDSFHWFSGYQHKFGLYAVDFDAHGRTRTPRASAIYYAAVVKQRTPGASYINPYVPPDGDEDYTALTIVTIFLFVCYRRAFNT